MTLKLICPVTALMPVVRARYAAYNVGNDATYARSV